MVRRSPPLSATVAPTGASDTRLFVVDVARGLAVVLMVFFHFVWDLQYFGLLGVNVFSTPWQIFARSIGSSFIFLLGLSLALRHQRVGLTTAYVLRRVSLLFGLGMSISLATYLFVGASYVRFGILHLLGAATLLVLPWVNVRAQWSALAGGALLIAGYFLGRIAVPFPWLIWLGLPQAGVEMVDYYPLLPWSGFALLGLSAGRAITLAGGPPERATRLSASQPSRALRWLGRRSLTIYLLHQPVLISLLLTIQALRSR